MISATGCTSANWGIVLAIVAAIAIWFIINKTTLGYRLRAVGYNNHAAQYGGVNSNKAVMTAMAISGALSGLEFLGIELDQEVNANTMGWTGVTQLSTDASKVKVYMIPTNEELVIAKDTEALVKAL